MLQLLLTSLGLWLAPGGINVAAAVAATHGSKHNSKNGNSTTASSSTPEDMWGFHGFLSKQWDEKQSSIDSGEIDAFVNNMVAMWRPILANIGFSGVLGACSAAALKSVGRIMAAFLGLGFISLQVLTYTGIVTVNWTKVHETAKRVLDTNGDGRLDVDEYKRSLKRGLIMLSQGIPSTSGFLAGFLLGLRVF